MKRTIVFLFLAAGLLLAPACSNKKSDIQMEAVVGEFYPIGTSGLYELHVYSDAYSNTNVAATLTRWKYEIFAQGEKVLELNPDNYTTYICLPGRIKTQILYGVNDYLEVELGCTGIDLAFVNGKVWDSITITYDIEDQNGFKYSITKTNVFVMVL